MIALLSTLSPEVMVVLAFVGAVVLIFLANRQSNATIREITRVQSEQTKITGALIQITENTQAELYKIDGQLTDHDKNIRAGIRVLYKLQKEAIKINNAIAAELGIKVE